MCISGIVVVADDVVVVEEEEEEDASERRSILVRVLYQDLYFGESRTFDVVLSSRFQTINGISLPLLANCAE